MKIGDFVRCLVIILLFGVLFVISFLSAGIDNIKKNWPVYRCNPVIMPIAGYLDKDPIENFTFCISNIQKNLMDYFLAPLNYVISLANAIGKNLMNSIQSIRILFDWLRNAISGVIENIFGVFLNVVVQTQTLIIKIKSIIAKLVGVATTTVYIIDGANKTGQSVWNGPIGKVVRILCFSPETQIKLKKGNYCKMKNLKLDDILENGSKVIVTMKIRGNPQSNYYKIFSKKMGEYIYVTGQHLIENPDTGLFIPVREYGDAIKTDICDDELSCLITDDHLIPIGEYTFWDWEDGEVL